MGHGDQRPSPDALLAAAAREQRGKLKIFLGAAPGVGKTYEMLQEARRRREAGEDVVIAVVETHGRLETEALVRGFETVPRRRVSYKGRMLEEMDLDAVLARRPALVLVDELAHSNAPGSRHPKRHLDVEELLAAGIDVYTTLNVQHVESLNDVVAQITRIRVRETVPDRIIDAADAIEVIDLTPDDLMQRLREGKVYVKDQAQRALKHYFSPGNLTALRELALRRTAQRVDEQMLGYMREHAIAGPWAAGERVLVCLGEGAGAEQLVRRARRIADGLRAKWTALHIETPRHRRLGEAERHRIAEALRTAERLGGEAVTLPGYRIADEVLAFSRENNVTQIILGKSQRSRWFELWHGSVVRDLVRRSGDITVQVVAETGETTVAPVPAPRRIDLKGYLVSGLAVACAVPLGLAIDWFVDAANLSMVFLIAVLLSAVGHGLGPSLCAAGLSVAAYNFFFLPPLYTFTIADPSNVVALVFFLIVAVLTSNLAARMRAQALAARAQAKRTAALYAFSRKLAALADLDDLLWATAFQIASMLHVQVMLLLPEEDGAGLVVHAGYPPDDQLDDADLAAARWAWAHNRPAGRGADTLPGAKRLFLPMRTARGPVGVIGIDRPAVPAESTAPLLTPEEGRLLDALIDQAAIAIERIQLAGHVDEARLLAETERLRSALLTSISHDLKTPLASILGAATSLRSYADLHDADTRDEMLATVQEEAERLNRFVGNLLDMTRLDSGALEPRRDPVDPGDAVGSAVRRAGRLLAQHRVGLRIADGLPLLTLDFVLLEQVLVNLLDNAAKYAPAGSEILVTAERDADGVRLAVSDQGPGIPEEDLERVFDKFFRVQAADRQRAGTGLGLAICRGFTEAMGGTIAAANRPGGGAEIMLHFPAGLIVA